VYANEIAADDFILLQADLPVVKARQLIEKVKTSHIIVHRTVPDEYYYLYTRAETLDILARAHDQDPIYVAFDLHEHDATATTDAYANAANVRDRSVVIEEARVVGFIDAASPGGTLEKPKLRRPEVFGTARRIPTPPSRPGPSRRSRGGAGAARGIPTPHPPPTPSSRSRRSTRRRGVEPEPVPRFLVADFPDQVQLGTVVSLLISLSAKSESHPALPMALPVGANVDVVVMPKSGFVLEGSGEGSLTVTSEENALPLQFKLKATKLGTGKLLILAFQQGRPLGSITIAPTIMPADQPVDRERSVREQRVPEVSFNQPDLSLLILEQHNGGKPTFTIRIWAVDPALQLNFKQYGPVQLQMNPLEYFQDFFKDIENMKIDTAPDRAAVEQRLGAKGTNLFESLFPTDLRVLFWSLRNRIRTVQVQSEEPWIPWELCKLSGKENGRIVEGKFFCEAFSITRWLLEIPQQPKLKLTNMALVVPRDSGLPWASREREYVLSLGNGGRRVEPIQAEYLSVRKTLAAGTHDGWHFTGHGGFRDPDPNRSKILLEEQGELIPEDLSGVLRNLGSAKPLVFLNACQVGRSAMSLTDIGGWAAQFLRAGAAAFVGAYWSVYDQPAYNFCKAFYRHLLSGVPIGKAVQKARQDIKPLGDPTWLAYTIYADPLATVE